MISFSNMCDADAEMVWDWIQQFPEYNCDDYSPKSLGEYIKDFMSCETISITIINWDGKPFGVVKTSFPSDRIAVCDVIFDRNSHGSYKIYLALKNFLNVLWEQGYEKVMGFPFTHNERIYKILKVLGATEEGCLRKQTVQNGIPIDLRILSFFPEK